MKTLIASLIFLAFNASAKEAQPTCQTATFVKYCKVAETVYVDQTVSPATRKSTFAARLTIFSSEGKTRVDDLATVDTYTEAQSIIDAAAVCKQ